MNYVIAPFGYAKGSGGMIPNMQQPRSYIRRDTAIRGVMRSVWMMAVPTNQVNMGHSEANDGNWATNAMRFPINLDKTIEQFEKRLNDQNVSVSSRSGNLYRSASEICDVDLYPGTTGGVTAPTVTNWATFWNNSYAATGDNMRERPYAHIFPRLTTKSNVFTVHMRCQTIKKGQGSKPGEFDPKKDQIVGEYRGSSVIERFIDPNDKELQNYNPTSEKVDPYYRYRIVSTKHFTH
jgi:hypothetical protein